MRDSRHVMLYYCRTALRPGLSDSNSGIVWFVALVWRTYG
jgi:hypothetical protein